MSFAKDLEEKIGDSRERMNAANIHLDEMADMHERLSRLESVDVKLSRRITALEDGQRGHYNDDPMNGLFSPSILWAIALLTLAPVIVDLVKQWKSQSS